MISSRESTKWEGLRFQKIFSNGTEWPIVMATTRTQVSETLSWSITQSQRKMEIRVNPLLPKSKPSDRVSKLLTKNLILSDMRKTSRRKRWSQCGEKLHKWSRIWKRWQCYTKNPRQSLMYSRCNKSVNTTVSISKMPICLPNWCPKKMKSIDLQLSTNSWKISWVRQVVHSKQMMKISSTDMNARKPSKNKLKQE